MEPISEYLPTNGQTSTSKDSNRLTELFGADVWDESIRRRCASDINDALITINYCPQCPNIQACQMPSPGWQMGYDGAASVRYRKPIFRARRCDHFSQRERERQITIDPKFSAATFDNYKPETVEEKRILKTCQKYAKSLGLATKAGLVLAGKPGTGKTHLATAIYRATMERGFDVAMLPVPELLDEMKQSMRGDGVAVVRNKAQLKFLVILDDLGAERVTDWVREELYKIIDHRYRQQYPTIFTTNCTPAELEDHIGTRAFDRICEMTEYVQFTGESRRRR